jgi:hypothetical protein
MPSYPDNAYFEYSFIKYARAVSLFRLFESGPAIRHGGAWGRGGVAPTLS